MNNDKFEIYEIVFILVPIFMILIVSIFLYKEYSFGKHTGTVIDKQYQAAYVSYTSSNIDGGTLRMPTVYPERWLIKIEKDNKSIWIDVSEKEYYELKIGDCYNCQEE